MPVVRKAIINGFTLDAAITENHNYDSEVTSYPVEIGGDITDHVRARPVTVDMECVVSDTPIGIMQQIRSGTTLPSDDALAALLGMRSAREPVTIETSLKTYTNMVLQNFSIPRSNNNGAALRFNVSFIQIEFITNNRTTIQTSSPRGQNKRNLGNKSLKEVAEAQAAAIGGTLRSLNNIFPTL